MMPLLHYIEIQAPHNSVQRILLDKSEYIIGRNNQTCSLVVDDNDISRRHVKLSHQSDGHWILTDLNSTNGTTVNGILIQRGQPILLKPGQTVIIGNTKLVLYLSGDFASKRIAKRVSPYCQTKSNMGYIFQTSANPDSVSSIFAAKNPFGVDNKIENASPENIAGDRLSADVEKSPKAEKKHSIGHGYIGIDDRDIPITDATSDSKKHWVAADERPWETAHDHDLVATESLKKIFSTSPRLLFDVIDRLLIVSVEEINSVYLECAFDDWYQDIKGKYTGISFLNQIEENTVRFVETTFLSRNYMVDYLVSGDTDTANQPIPTHLVVKPLIAFLKGESGEKPPQVSTLDYLKLRDLRESGDKRRYHKKLYTICNLYYPAMKIMGRVLTLSLVTPQLAGIASLLPRYQISEAVIERALFRTKMTLGLLPSNHNDGKLLKPKM